MIADVSSASHTL